MNKQELLEKARKLKCIQKDKVAIGDMVYRSYPDLDKMVDSTELRHRKRIASMGYGLDKLKDDVSPEVRLEVAKRGYYLQQFLKDSSEKVRLQAEMILG